MDNLVLLETANKIRKLQRKMYEKISNETGIHYTSIEILCFLHNHKSVQTAKELCDLLKMKSNLVSFHVDKLVKEGFVVRDQIDGDRRKIKLILTEISNKIAEKCNVIKDKLLKKITAGCSKEEWDKFSSFVLKLNKNIDEVCI